MSGRYRLWIRYGDVREKSESFDAQIEQPGREMWKATYGERPVVEEDNEMKLYWNWAFAWDYREADLKAGPAVLSLHAGHKEPSYRQIDCLVLTTDTAYRPLIRARMPVHSARDRLLPDDRLTVKAMEGGLSEISTTVQAGGLRVIQLG